MSQSDLNDGRLMQQVASGHRDSVEVLVRRHGDAILTFINRSVADKTQAEDIFQEVFLAVWANARQYRYPKPFQPWLYRIALNKCREYFRRNKYRTTLAMEEPWPSSERSPEEEAISCETNAIVATAVSELPSDRREIVILRVWNGLSYMEIAEIVGRTDGAVRSKMHQALKQLRSVLQVRLP